MQQTEAGGRLCSSLDLVLTLVCFLCSVLPSVPLLIFVDYNNLFMGYSRYFGKKFKKKTPPTAASHATLFNDILKKQRIADLSHFILILGIPSSLGWRSRASRQCFCPPWFSKIGRKDSTPPCSSIYLNIFSQAFCLHKQCTDFYLHITKYATQLL